MKQKIPSHDKYITTQEFNSLTTENFGARSKQTKLATKDDIDSFVKKKDEKLRTIDNKVN